MLELTDLLRENFFRYDGIGEVPSQIHSYLSSNFKHLRKLPKDDPALRNKGKDRWYVPDPRKAGDLEKVRERALLREFDGYRETNKHLKRFRSEAIRRGSAGRGRSATTEPSWLWGAGFRTACSRTTQSF